MAERLQLGDKNLRAYARQRDEERRAGLKRLFKEVKAAGLYDANYTGEA